MTMNPLCAVCEAKTDARLCGRCTRQLRKAIEALPGLLVELDVTIARQDRGTGAALYAVKRSKVQIPGLHYEEGDTTLPSTPWPFSWDAANTRWDVESTVVEWARYVHARHWPRPKPLSGPVCLVGCEHSSCTAIRAVGRATAHLAALLARPGALLVDSLDAIRNDELAGKIHDELTYLRTQLLRAIDRQAPDVFAGRCNAAVPACNAELYAHTGDAEVRCGACGQAYDLIARLRALARRVDDEWARPQLIADALTTLDEPVNASTLRTWIQRDVALGRRLARSGAPAPYPLVLQVGIDDDGRALYRVGDVRARIAWSSAAIKPRHAALVGAA